MPTSEVPDSSVPSESPTGDMPNESSAPMEGSEGGYEGGQQAPKKPTDIKGVKEGTAEYAAISLILKVANGEAEGLKSLVSEDANSLLKGLRADDPTKALAEAKELIGQVQPVSSRLVDRDTVVSFRNTNNKILQFYVRKVQGEYIVRELRVREAEDSTPRRRRN